MSATEDRPKTGPSDFMAKRESHDIRVTGKAFGDYRIESATLVRAPHQHNRHTLVLDLDAKIGPATPIHNDLIREFPLEYVQRPADAYTHVEIVNGHQHFTVDVT